MKNVAYLLLWLFSSVSIASAINADIRSYIFRQDNFQYVEIDYYIPTYKLLKIYQADSSFNYKIHLTVLLKQNNKIIKAEKFELTSPFSKESQALLHNIKWAIDPGQYDIESQLSDVSNPLDEISLINTLVVNNIPKSIYISDVQIYSACRSSTDVNANMYKNGFIYEPLPYQLIDRNQNVLYAYLEVYQINKYADKNYFLKYEILQEVKGEYHKLNEWFKSKTSEDKGMVLQTKNISALPTGHYKLIVSLLDKKKNALHSSQCEFDRVNPFWDRLIANQYENVDEEAFFQKLNKDSLHYYLRALNVILPSTERDVLSEIDHEERIVEQRMYLYHFWKDLYGDECIARFLKFMKSVNYADKNFVSGFRYGFESDRGVTFLKYGPPTEVIRDDNDNGAFPYEIWKYDKMATGQTNVKFLFYNPDLTEANYILLHTNCYGGRFNNKWEIELYRKVKDEFEGSNLTDATRMKKNINRHAREYFEN